MLSTNRAQRVESSVARLRIAVLEPERLELAGGGEPFAGSYRRAQVRHVRGVLTYRERMALTARPPRLVRAPLDSARPLRISSNCDLNR